VDHRIEITIADEVRDAGRCDRLLEALYDLLPSPDAVIDQDLEGGSLTAAFVVAGESTVQAAQAGIGVFEAASARAGVESAEAITLRACSSPR
jgi:hypothetical protein